MDDHTRSTTELTNWNREFIERLASFLKWSFMYDRNHERVRVCAEALVECLQQVEVDSDIVPLTMTDQDFCVVDTMVETSTPRAKWLRQAMIKAALGGIRLHRGVHIDSLSEFAERFRADQTIRRFPTHEERWGEQIPGLQALELRFVGHHNEEDSDVLRNVETDLDPVEALVMQSPELVDQLDDLRYMLWEAAESDDSHDEITTMDVLATIRAALPNEARLDPHAAVELIQDVLRTGIPRIQKIMLDGQQRGHQETMEHLTAEVGRELFTRRTKDVVDAGHNSLPEGRPEDETIVDDVDEMIAEFETLPVRRDPLILDDPVVAAEEFAGVLIHQLVTSDKEYTIGPIQEQLTALLRRHPQHLEFLRPYIDACLDTEKDPDYDELRPWRAVAFAAERDYHSLLPEGNYLTPEVVQRNFPNLFAMFLDSLSPSEIASQKRLDEALNLIGTARIRDAAITLVSSGELMEPHRLEMLLSTGHGALKPVIERLLQNPLEWVVKEVVAYLRNRNLPDAESTALRVVRPFSYLTSDYLLALNDLDSGTVQMEWLRGEASRLMRNYLVRTADREDLAEHRARAASQLSLLPSSENLKLLGKLRREAITSIPTRARRLFRRAASRAYRGMKRRLSRLG